MTLDRAVQAFAGVMILVSVALTQFISSRPRQQRQLQHALS